MLTHGSSEKPQKRLLLQQSNALSSQAVEDIPGVPLAWKLGSMVDLESERTPRERSEERYCMAGQFEALGLARVKASPSMTIGLTSSAVAIISRTAFRSAKESILGSSSSPKDPPIIATCAGNKAEYFARSGDLATRNMTT